MRPLSIAIVGVSPQPGSPGGGVLDNLERYGYGGDIHLVSRSRGEVKGRPCVASIDDLPEGIDTALLTIPRAAIEPALAAPARRAVAPPHTSPPPLPVARAAWQAPPAPLPAPP